MSRKANNEIVKILVERDGYSLEDAIAAVVNMAEEHFENTDLADALEALEELEDQLLSEFQLEPDYVLEVLAILDQMD